MSDVPQFKTIPEVKAALKAEGSNWFDPKTMEWWHSRVESNVVFRGRFFITSEQREPDTERKFSVRKVARNSNGKLSIDTVGEFHSHATIADALQAMHEAGDD